MKLFIIPKCRSILERMKLFILPKCSSILERMKLFILPECNSILERINKNEIILDITNVIIIKNN